MRPRCIKKPAFRHDWIPHPKKSPIFQAVRRQASESPDGAPRFCKRAQLLNDRAKQQADDRPASAVASIEITPEMLEVGARVQGSDEPNGFVGDDGHCRARQVFEAMILASLQFERRP